MTSTTYPALLPFNSEKINDKYLVTNMMGCWDALNEGEFRQLHNLSVMGGGNLFNRLLKRGLIVDSDNLQRVIDDYRSLNANLFTDTSLHIAVVTKRCNLRCTYCHAEGGASSEDMSIETASRVLQYLFDVSNNNVTLEFQGGEALLNWPVVQYLTENARRINTLRKNLSIAIVTNMMLMDDEKMKFLADHDVIVCSSLDGPADIHDTSRIDVAGRSSYAKVVEKINRYESKFGLKAISPCPMRTYSSMFRSG